MIIKLDGSSVRRRKDTEILTSQGCRMYLREGSGRYILIAERLAESHNSRGQEEGERISLKKREYIVRKLYGIYRSNACYLQQILSAHGYKINHSRIHRILEQEGFALIEEVDKV